MGQRPLHPPAGRDGYGAAASTRPTEDLAPMIQPAFGDHTSCPMCTTFRVRTVPWSVRSGPGDSPVNDVTVWECFGCGHVWRKPAAADAREARVA